MLSTDDQSDLSLTRVISIFENALALCGIDECHYAVQRVAIAVDDRASDAGMTLTDAEFVNRVADELARDLPVNRSELEGNLPAKFAREDDTQNELPSLGRDTEDILDLLDEMDQGQDDYPDLDLGDPYWGVDRGRNTRNFATPATRTVQTVRPPNVTTDVSTSTTSTSTSA